MAAGEIKKETLDVTDMILTAKYISGAVQKEAPLLIYHIMTPVGALTV